MSPFSSACRVGLIALVPWLACDRGPGPETCFDVCGPGTLCVAERCVPAPPSADEAPPASEDRKRGKKRNRKRKRATEASPDHAALPPFEPVDDRHVPRYDPNETQQIGPGSGSERIPDHTIREHLRQLEPAFNACIARAAEYSPTELPPGEVDFEFGIRPTGKLAGVNVKAPKALQAFGIVPCLRVALFRHRFPSYDGPTTGVTYSFRVE